MSIEETIQDPLRKMLTCPYTKIADGDDDDVYAVSMMKECVRILEHYLGKRLLYRNRMVAQVLQLLQSPDIRNRCARTWALCFLMCHFEPIYEFVQAQTQDKQRLNALMQVLPTWMEAQKNFPYTIDNVRNLIADFLLYYFVPLYIFGPQAPPQPPGASGGGASVKRLKR